MQMIGYSLSLGFFQVFCLWGYIHTNTSECENVSLLIHSCLAPTQVQSMPLEWTPQSQLPRVSSRTRKTGIADLVVFATSCCAVKFCVLMLQLPLLFLVCSILCNYLTVEKISSLLTTQCACRECELYRDVHFQVCWYGQSSFLIAS